MATKKRHAPVPDLSFITDSLRPLAEPVDGLVPDPENVRTHDEANLRAIVASLRQFGQRKPIVVNRATRHIEAGNGTFEAAKKLGWTHLAVVWVEDDPAAARGFALADNRTAELADWDQLKLESLLSEMAEEPLCESLYRDLLLDELREKADDDEALTGVAGQAVDDKWSLVVDCADEGDQHALYERLSKEGRTCRPLTL